jgi:flagellar hook assembly protein FlgD
VPGHAYTWFWYGRNDAGHFVPDGDYYTRAEWSSPSCPDITLRLFTTIDNTRPTFRSVGNFWKTFYPRHDDAFGPFRDFATPRVIGVSEPVTKAEGVLYHHGGTKVLRRVHLETGTGGTLKWHWNGRYADGRLYPAGWYDVRFRLRDALGNTTYPPRVTFRLSHEHVVGHHIVKQKGAALTSWVLIDTPCPSTVSTTTTRYADGLRIVYCSVDNDNTLNANYLFRLPRAVVYQIHPYVFGVANPGGFPLRFAVWDFAGNGWHVVGDADRAEGRYDLDTVVGTRFLSPRHNLRLATLPDWFTDQTEDYDLRYVGVDVRYGTLAD